MPGYVANENYILDFGTANDGYANHFRVVHDTTRDPLLRIDELGTVKVWGPIVSMVGAATFRTDWGNDILEFRDANDFAVGGVHALSGGGYLRLDGGLCVPTHTSTSRPAQASGLVTVERDVNGNTITVGLLLGGANGKVIPLS